MSRDVTNRKAKEHVDEDQNGVIVAGPEAHARERVGKHPAQSERSRKDKPEDKPAGRP
ncbi:hypothetical protein [Mycoplana sp. MJR14]|uniref:hypothetical protein n=1 Tax=Mycoplana sp. MJR14 TaxID=3032583 RepID=UPI0023DC7A3B|nr:hypothetical protein [Mycoplana sp. MJR14]MDF1631370.1 hypothetical protein [Mycoplana sp. MJR14]